MKKSVLFLIGMSYCTLLSHAQVTSGVDAQENINQMGGTGNIVRTMKPLKADTKGSPILFDEPKQALPYKEGVSLGPANFNVHVGEKKLLIQTRSGVNFMEKLSIDSLIFEDSKRVFVNGQVINPALEDVPYEVVHLDDGGTIYIEHQVQLIPASYQGAYNTGANYDEYIKKMNFYVIKGDMLESIKFNRGWFKQNYANNAGLNDFVNSKLLKYSKYEDQLEIIDFIRK